MIVVIFIYLFLSKNLSTQIVQAPISFVKRKKRLINSVSTNKFLDKKKKLNKNNNNYVYYLNIFIIFLTF